MGMKMDLVCSGGGVKLAALAGAYESLCNKGFQISHAAGTSAGSILSAVAIAGYSAAEIKEIIMATRFNQFLDGGRFKLFNLLYNNGFYKGDAFYCYIKNILSAKGLKTFGDVKYDNLDVKYNYRLKIIASDVTAAKITVFPDDLPNYGIDPDSFEIAKAIRCSMSIPFFFFPVKLNKSILVDGGLISNFPIWIFDSNEEPHHPTFGLNLYSNTEGKPKKTNHPINLTKALLATMLQSHDKQWIRPDDMLNRIINIPTGDIGPIDFGIDSTKKEYLYSQGAEAANSFLRDWNWARYRKWGLSYRRNTENE